MANAYLILISIAKPGWQVENRLGIYSEDLITPPLVKADEEVTQTVLASASGPDYSQARRNLLFLIGIKLGKLVSPVDPDLKRVLERAGTCLIEPDSSNVE